MGMIVNRAACEGGRRIARIDLDQELRLSYGDPTVLATVVILGSCLSYRFRRAGWC